MENMDALNEGDTQSIHAGADRPKVMPRSSLPRQTRARPRRPGKHPDNEEVNRRLLEQYLASRDAEDSDTKGNSTTQLSDEAPERRKRKRSDNIRGSDVPEKSISEAPEQPKRKKRPIPPDWRPPLAIGESLGENLSRIEHAERLVLQWEAILENARQTQPFSNLSGIEKRLEDAKREREELEETEENLTPFEELETTKRAKIADRLDTLEETLRRNKSPDGEVNIRAAIEGYKDGTIQCWEKWTLVYAGHIVDFCPSYESFTEDREERMDRYFQVLGRGWLWFEPPLAPNTGFQSDHLLAATWAQPATSKSFALATEWYITMGFRRVKAFHSRIDVPETTSDPQGEARKDGQNDDAQGTVFSVVQEQKLGSQTKRRSSGKVLKYQPRRTGMHKEELKTLKWTVYDDPDGPRCFFKMHLDSGASHPMLFEKDFELLNIDPENYPPQSAVRITTVNDCLTTVVYEIRVDICRHNGESLVGENPVWPSERHELGGIAMVLAKNGEPPAGASAPLNEELLNIRRERGEDVSEDALARRPVATAETRLSGLMPFKVCYSACAPGTKLWFGEDRRDVLGMDRMPGQRRFESHKQPKSHPAPVDMDDVGRPRRIAFEHELGPDKRIIDRDVKGHPGASVVRVIEGTEVKEYRWEPRRLTRRRVMKKRQEVKKEQNRMFLGAFRRMIPRSEGPASV